MTTDPLALLAASNPVPELPAVAPTGSFEFLDEPRPPAMRRAPRRRVGGLVWRAAIAAGVLAGGGVLVLSTGSSGPGVDIAAAAFAATSAHNGVIEAEFVVRSGRRGEARTPLFRRREWLDAATGRRREQTLDRAGKVQVELATAPNSAETWVSGPTPRGTIVRFNLHVPSNSGLKPEGLALYRQLYQERGVRVVGREKLDGQLLWRLESVVAWATHRLRGPLTPLEGEVVLVDPRTYLPIIERQVDLTRPGHPTTIETRIVRARRLPRTASSERLVLLRTAHPGVRPKSVSQFRVTQPVRRALGQQQIVRRSR